MATATAEPPPVFLYETLAPLEESFEDEYIAFSPSSSGHTPLEAGLQSSQNVNGEVSTLTVTTTNLRASAATSTVENIDGGVADEFQDRIGAIPASHAEKSQLRDGIDSSDQEVLERDVSERVVECIQVETTGASLSRDEDVDFLSLDAMDLGNESLGPDGAMEDEARAILSDIKTSAGQEAPPWARTGNSGGTWFRSPFLQLHQEIVDFCNFVSPTEEERELRKAAVQRVADVIMSIWPSCQVKVFGSFATGLFLPTSDCDVVILESGCQVPQDGLKAIAKALNRKHLVKNLQVIGKARVPIVKFVETESNIAFDISFDVANGPDAAEFIKDAMASLPPLRPLCLVLKIFLQQRELNEVYTGGIGSYALLVMLLTHLQMHPSRRNVNSRGEPSPLESNLGILLVDFFDFYGRVLNMREVGISCRSGGRFFSKVSRGFVDLGRPYLLSVEDPQSPDNDIGKNSYNVAKVRSAFVLAHRLLTKLEVEGVSANVGLLGRIVRMDKILIKRKSIIPELPARMDSRIKLSDATTSGSSPAAFRNDSGTFVSTRIGASRWRDYEDDDFPRGGGLEPESKSSRKRKHTKDREDRDKREGDYNNSHSHHKRKRVEHEGESISGKSRRSKRGKDSVDLNSTHVSRYHEQLEIEQADSIDIRIGNGKVSKRKKSGMKGVKGHEDGKRTPDGKKNRWAKQNRHRKDDSHEEGEIILKDDSAAFATENDSHREEIELGAGNGHNNHKRWLNEGRSSKPVLSRTERRPWSPEGENVATGRSGKKVVITKPAHKKIRYL